ncbi:MAG: class I SAM-dependent methyltransferase, partial [Candidatus Eremiobacteraeota bacterium]|nr:class I SAM-dependent methyltransferase [Candidatus Eremiobacteraeota bacterium]
MTTYEALAAHYAPDRLGYSNDLYNTLLGFGLTPRFRVLDVGCGTGLGSRVMIENGMSVTGVDASKTMIELARERYPAATWVEGKAEALPFQEATF